MKKIKYIAFYSDSNQVSESRYHALAAKNKIDYITKVLVDLNYDIELVSPSWTNEDRGWYKNIYTEISDKIYLRLFHTFGGNSKLLKGSKQLFSYVQLFLYLLFNTEAGENLIVYHSTTLSIILILVKKLKKINIILEVEEIYSDIQKLSTTKKILEKIMFDNADSFIYSTSLLNNKVNNHNKPYITVHGSYEVQEKIKSSFNDDKIHLVYAGTFDLNKGGAIAAIEASQYLTEKYHLHIIGFGTKEEINHVKDTINTINKKSNSLVTYDGMLIDQDLFAFLQKCHIGLSTQNIVGEYNDSSFPSKILTYLANGLEVVSGNIKVVTNSELSPHIYFYKKQKPKEIANTIMEIKINANKRDAREILYTLNGKFTTDMEKLIKH